ncbi:ferredoxin [Rhodococcus sp. HNM0569]|uniref:ferredoxin n=1 Tax=Rhodococcus sp. HNM0569 TaxID=2716340 RepID=UPI00146B93E2|nr:ferredoxin [Rhodococcus sp. HNM0569]NLU82259.1 ferredoxin [Rhodococcus sp. HNM0569]
MEIRVDPDRCEANGVCVGIAPDLFELDDDDVLHITDPTPPAERTADAESAIASCPRAALFAAE